MSISILWSMTIKYFNFDFVEVQPRVDPKWKVMCESVWQLSVGGYLFVTLFSQNERFPKIISKTLFQGAFSLITVEIKVFYHLIEMHRLFHFMGYSKGGPLWKPFILYDRINIFWCLKKPTHFKNHFTERDGLRNN